jgi:bifunctional NMN adenylyltransferase/nudix hydrolase
VFDDPNRSLRGRTITNAYLIKLDDSEKLPRVKGGDDAAKAKWISLTDFEEMQQYMFDDHFFIANHMINQL